MLDLKNQREQHLSTYFQDTQALQRQLCIHFLISEKLYLR